MMRTFAFFIFIFLLVNFTSAQPASVYFDTDKSTLTPAAKHLLDSLFARGLHITDTLTISCHCDVRADSAYNYALSMRRARSVKAYLQNAGVKSTFLLLPFGEVNPAYPNSETERFKNRRCDVILPDRPAIGLMPTKEVVEVKDWSEGFTMRLEGLEFVGNQAVPYSEGMPVLYELFEKLATYADVKIALHGHVCCGDDLPLSIARAKSVYDFLVANGIDSSRLSYTGFSNSRPLVEEVDEASQKHNRRVEMVVVQPPKAEPVTVTSKPKTFMVALREIPWDAKNNVPTYEGSYNLDLLAKMISRSKGYRYALTIYTARSNQLSARTNYLSTYFVRKRVSVNKMRIIKGDPKRYPKMDILTLEINPAP